MLIAVVCFSVNYFSSKALALLQVLWTELEVAAWQYNKLLTKGNQVGSLALFLVRFPFFPGFSTSW